jgi:hypothetical protein
VINDKSFSVTMNDGELTLKEARKSAKWPKWEKAIKAELAQLKTIGTWKLVKKPKNAILIVNKWVFVKKRNKASQLTKYKARLTMEIIGANYHPVNGMPRGSWWLYN